MPEITIPKLLLGSLASIAYVYVLTALVYSFLSRKEVHYASTQTHPLTHSLCRKPGPAGATIWHLHETTTMITLFLTFLLSPNKTRGFVDQCRKQVEESQHHRQEQEMGMDSDLNQEYGGFKE